MSEDKKEQKYIGIKVLNDAQPMSVEEAKEAGLVKADYEGESDGVKLTHEDGHESWTPKEVFDKSYSPLNATNLKVLNKLKDPISEIKKVVKLQGHVDQIEKKQWSLKRLGAEVLKVYDVDLNEINNDKF